MSTEATRIRNVTTGSGQALGAMTCVGSSIGVSGLLTDTPLYASQAVRYLLASLVIVLFLRIRGLRIPAPHGTEWPWLIGVAAAGQVMFNVALVEGTTHADPAVLGVAVASVPLVLAVAAPLALRRRPGRNTVVGAATVTAGAIAIHGLTATSLTGLGWSLTVLAGEAAFTLMAVPLLPTLGAFGVSVHSTWLAATMFAVLSATTEGPSALGRLDSGDLAATTYLAVVVTAVAFILWYGAVQRVGAATAGLFTGVTPAAAALSGILLHSTFPSPMVWTGIAMVALGLLVGLRSDQPRVTARKRSATKTPHRP